MNIVLGLIMIAAGVGMIVKTEWLINNFGRIAWFDEVLGSEGGSRLGYKLIGLAITIIGVIVLTGSGPDLMRWLVSPLVKYSKPAGQ